MNDLKLTFTAHQVESFVDSCRKALQDRPTNVLLRPFDLFAMEVAKRLPVEIRIFARPDEIQVERPFRVELMDDSVSAGLVVLCSTDLEALADCLMEYVDSVSIQVVAPITSSFGWNRPLFLISIPKSGTHLLYRLSEVLGFWAGVVCPDSPKPRTWYCLEYSNSHTSARDFFVDMVKRSPFGNRDHPFMRSPAIFIYRNPLDILVSEANYYHIDGKTAFAGYFQGKSFEERLLTLIDDPWLLGSIRHRVGAYLPWLAFPNVIPVSFEELIGHSGGGDWGNLVQLLWSIQLKLQVPGKPTELAAQLYQEDSPTFFKGQIGVYRTAFTDEALKKFNNLPQDFMAILGYDCELRSPPAPMPKRAIEFRRRRLRFSSSDFHDIPITVESNFAGHNIVKFRRQFYIIPQNGPIDMRTADLRRLKSMPSLIEARNFVVISARYNWLIGLWHKAVRHFKRRIPFLSL